MFRHHRHMIASLGLVWGTALLCTATASAQATATEAQLKWKFKEGQKYQLKMEQEMTQSMEIQGQPMNTSNNTTTYMTWLVTEVDEGGNASITSTIDRMTMKMNAPMMGNVDIDTDNDEQPAGMAAQIKSAIQPLIGAEFKQKMSPQGEVTDVQIPDGTVADTPGPTGQMGMNSKQISEMASKVSPKFPTGNVKIGQSWNDKSVSDSPVGQIEVANDYVYEGTTMIDDRLTHRIAVDTRMAFPAGPNAMGMTIKVGEQNTKGALFFDADKGQMVKSEVDQDMVLNIGAAGHDIVQHMKQKVRATFTEVSPGS